MRRRSLKAKALAVLPWDIVANEALIEDPLPHEMAEQHQASCLGIKVFQIGQFVAFGLKPGKHNVRVVVLGEPFGNHKGTDVAVDSLIVYK